MTERDYLHYEMNKDEMDKWEQLVADIKKSFFRLLTFLKFHFSFFLMFLKELQWRKNLGMVLRDILATTDFIT